MLFMGTKRFPQENSFFSYLNSASESLYTCITPLGFRLLSIDILYVSNPRFLYLVYTGHSGSTNAATTNDDSWFYFKIPLPSPRVSAAIARSATKAASAGLLEIEAKVEMAQRRAAAEAEDILLGPTGALTRFSGRMKPLKEAWRHTLHVH
jgi:hypothetical protein